MMDDSYEERRRFRILSWIAFGGAFVVGAQIALLLLRGEILCLNEGCRVVESLTTVSPLVFNLLGFAWFAALTLIMRRADRRPFRGLDWPRIFLIAGMAVEAVLMGFQLFVARALCSYCLVVFAIVLALNIMAGRRQTVAAGAVFAAVMIMFPLLRFGQIPRTAAPGKRALDAGTYAVRRCSEPAKQLYLIFSSNCPHCREVITTLENCNSCNFHFNPIDRLKTFELAGIERLPTYAPEVNRALLALLGIDVVPVLLAVGPEGISVIKGEKSIIGFIKEECFRTAPVLYLDPSRAIETDPLRMFSKDEDGCTATVECQDEEKNP